MQKKTDKIDCRVVREADSAQIVRLYREAGWWEDEFGEDFIPEMVRNSCCFVAAFDTTGQLVGMGRAVGDGCSDAYIQDIVVRQDRRRSGIGRQIVNTILENLRSRDIDWIGLIAAPGTESFYHALGFETMQGYIPMKLRTMDKGRS